MPRLPVYILIDCSGSMLRLMPTVQTCLKKIIDVLASDLRAVDTNGSGAVYVSLIPFNDDATPTPLAPLAGVKTPPLQALGKTQLGLALRALNASLDRDLIPNRTLADGSEEPGDFRPLVFLISDGEPSVPEQISWATQAAALRQRTFLQPLHIVALALGSKADVRVLQEIALPNETLLVTGDLGQLEQALMDYFDWIADTVSATLDTVTTINGSPASTSLPRFPQSISLAPPRRGQ